MSRVEPGLSIKMKFESKFNRQLQSNSAFMAKSVFDLNGLIQTQSDELYLDKDMGFPVWVSSTILFLSKVDCASITQISKALNFSHQLISQRIKMLHSLGLVEGTADPHDRRRTQYQLTPIGLEKARILDLYCVDAAEAFNDLSKEVGVDIQAVLNAAISALKKKSFGERFPVHEESYAQRIKGE